MATQLQDLTLKSLIEYTKDVVDWYELGIELDIDIVELDKIKRDHEHKGGEYCKSKVLQYWKSNYETSQEKIIAATTKRLQEEKEEREEQRKLKQKKEKLQKEESKTLAASSELQKSLQSLDKEVSKINNKQKRLQKQQKAVKESWSCSQIFWSKENEEWTEKAKSNQQLSEAIANNDHRESKAVIEDFLQRNHLPAYTELSTEAIVAYVNKEIVSTEAKRSQQLKLRQHQIKRYAKNMSELKRVTEEWRDLVKTHVDSVKQKIVMAMKELGLAPEKISSIDNQVEELQKTAENLGSAVTTSEKSLEGIHLQLAYCEAELQKHAQTFSLSYHQIIRSLTKLQDRIKTVNDAIADLQKTIEKLKVFVGASTIGGTGVGAAIGSIGGPLGFLVGAAFGAGVGFMFGAAITNDERQKAHRDLREKEGEKTKLENELANNKQAEKECQPTAKKAGEIINMWRDLGLVK